MRGEVRVFIDPKNNVITKISTEGTDANKDDIARIFGQKVFSGDGFFFLRAKQKIVNMQEEFEELSWALEGIADVAFCVDEEKECKDFLLRKLYEKRDNMHPDCIGEIEALINYIDTDGWCGYCEKCGILIDSKDILLYNLTIHRKCPPLYKSMPH